MPIPIVIGVADILNRSSQNAIQPVELMIQAIHAAISDTTLSSSFVKEIDSISVVNTWTWRYCDLTGLIAERLGVKNEGGYRELSAHGGNEPGRLFDEAARRIARGETKVGVVVGGEALGSLAACAAAGKIPPPGWMREDESTRSVSLAEVGRGEDNVGTRHSIGLPIHIYPLYENAFRAHRNQSFAENNIESANLYAEFAKVAEKHPSSWNYGKPALSAEVIGTVSRKNRMICFPYPLLMNAFNNVNLAGACILTSTEYAKELGIPEDRWIYPLGGAGTSESPNFWERPSFSSSPAISRSLDAGLESAGLKKEDIDMFDFYSCFPIIPKLACQHLDLSITKLEKPITLLGGLTSFGGAGNNYSMHAITTMVKELRKGKVRNGLILANGGVATYQHVVILSNRPGKSVYPARGPLPRILSDEVAPLVLESAEGEAVIETYTVEFNRDGNPKKGFVIGRLKASGERFVANEADQNSLVQLASSEKEQVGRRGWVSSGSDGRNVFSFDVGEKL